ncbi:uncharacterized protein METZ01_LOCUS193629 [marine metagenome]|uniref:Uncharacterized protein n=1 Tax=marine metagenome TaxID=408172 RepID=A0A382DRC8_9ZZZZ
MTMYSIQEQDLMYLSMKTIIGHRTSILTENRRLSKKNKAPNLGFDNFQNIRKNNISDL